MINTETPSPMEIIAAFADYLGARAAEGGHLARCVRGITCEDRIVTITFDASPSLLDLSPFENLAQFPGTAICFDNEVGAKTRPGVDKVVTQLPDGTPLGELTVAEIYKQGTGKDL